MLVEDFQEIAEEQWGPCPRCGSKRVHAVNKWVILGMLIFLGLMLAFYQVNSVLMFICFSLGSFLLFVDSRWHCKDCDFIWRRGKPKDYCFIRCGRCGYKSLMFLSQMDFNCPSCREVLRKQGKRVSEGHKVSNY